MPLLGSIGGASAKALGETLKHGSKPINTVTPVVSGTVTIGDTLSCTAGTWTGSPTITYAYQWFHNGTTAISGATNSTYVISSSDVGYTLSCEVTATNSLGVTIANSNTTVAVGNTYATLDPANKSTGIVLSNGNLTAGSSANNSLVLSNIPLPAGSTYWEVTMNNASDYIDVGIANAIPSTLGILGTFAYSMGVSGTNSTVYYSTSASSSGYTQLNGGNKILTAGDVIGIEFNPTTCKMTLWLNGVLMTGANPVTANYLAGLGLTYYAALLVDNLGSATVNFGASPFVYTVPSGANAGF